MLEEERAHRDHREIVALLHELLTELKARCPKNDYSYDDDEELDTYDI